MEGHYEIALKFGGLMKGDSLNRVSLRESVRQFFRFVFLTSLGEYKFDHNFGSYLWEQDFNQDFETTKWKENIDRSIRISVSQNLPWFEIEKVRTEVEKPEFRQQEEDEKLKIVFRKKVVLYASGIIKTTGEKLDVKESLIFSPFWHG